MNFEEESARERHFVLHVMNFIYGLSGKPLQASLQQMLDEYSREEEKYCTKNITRALLFYISDYLDSGITLVDLSSQAYQDLIKDLLRMYGPYDFLRFLAQYGLKSRFEYYEKKLLDSPMKFFSSMVRFLEEMRNNEHSVDFWERLDKAAGKVVAKSLEIIKSRNNKLLDVSADDDGSSEREFVLTIMHTISRLYSNPLPDHLRFELDEYMMVSLTNFHPSFEIALKIEADNQERNVANLGGDDAIYDYYYQLCTNNFTAKHFLEFSLCSTRKALLEFYVDSKGRSPGRACDRLCYILQNAKKDGKFYSLDDFVPGANEIIDDHEAKKAELKKGFEASTAFSDFSTVSTDLNSDRDNMFESFEYSLSAKDPVTVARKNAQSAIDSLIASASDAQSENKRINILVPVSQIEDRSAMLHEIPKSPRRKVIATGESAQPAVENRIAAGEGAQSAAETRTDNCEDVQSSTENTISSSENDQPDVENAIVPIKDAETGDPNLVTSGEQVAKAACRCCTTV